MLHGILRTAFLDEGVGPQKLQALDELMSNCGVLAEQCAHLRFHDEVIEVCTSLPPEWAAVEKEGL